MRRRRTRKFCTSHHHPSVHLCSALRHFRAVDIFPTFRLAGWAGLGWVAVCVPLRAATFISRTKCAASRGGTCAQNRARGPAHASGVVAVYMCVFGCCGAVEFVGVCVCVSCRRIHKRTSSIENIYHKWGVCSVVVVVVVVRVGASKQNMRTCVCVCACSFNCAAAATHTHIHTHTEN